jgi:hypothetical protein
VGDPISKKIHHTHTQKKSWRSGSNPSIAKKRREKIYQISLPTLLTTHPVHTSFKDWCGILGFQVTFIPNKDKPKY